MKLLFFSLLVPTILVSCSYKPLETGIIKIKGSDSMFQLTENLAEEYMKLNPGISIYVLGGGTSEGVKALIKNEIDICTASRNLKPEETKALADYYGSVGLFYLVAKDAVSVYLHPDNPVIDLSIEQLKEIFECNITNWNQLGGKDQKIIPVIRNINSGTHFYFQEHILGGGEYCPDAEIKETTLDIIKFVENNENAIGYGAIGYSGEVNYAKIDGIFPSEESAQNDTYPITRYLHFFTVREPKGIVKNFIDWVLSPSGQKVIKQSGFIPLWEISAENF